MAIAKTKYRTMEAPHETMLIVSNPLLQTAQLSIIKSKSSGLITTIIFFYIGGLKRLQKM